MPATDVDITSLIVFGSSDGGQSWSAVHSLGATPNHAAAGGLRQFALPSAEVDAAGTIYMAWADCRFELACSANDIVLSTSADGRSWSPVVRIPIDPVGSGVDHFLPGLGVNIDTSGATAHLALTYYYYPVANCPYASCQLFTGLILSTDGGATWGGQRTLAGPMAPSDLVNTAQGQMVGDYLSTSVLGAEGGETATSVFAVASPREPDVLHEDMYAATVRVAYAGPGQPVESGPVLSTRPEASDARRRRQP